MKKPRTVKRRKNVPDDLKPEYQLDYTRARPNRFAAQHKEGSRVIVLDPDVARVFTSPESVNEVLRALMETMPPRKGKAAS